MEKFVIKENGLYGDRRIIEKVVDDVLDEETGDELYFETIKIIMSRFDFDHLLNLIGKEAMFWYDHNEKFPENIGMEVIDVIEAELGINFTPDDIEEVKINVSKGKEVIKNVDKNGRIVLPKKWRDKNLKSASIKLEVSDNKIEVLPYEPEDISDLFGSIKVHMKSDRTDWKEMREELYIIGEQRIDKI